jgi:hypothetical protein
MIQRNTVLYYVMYRCTECASDEENDGYVILACPEVFQMTAETLPDDAITQLLPYVDEDSLRLVRIRTGPPWSWIPRLLRTGAVTLGRDVSFRPGLYRVTDARGLALVAHECTHVHQYRELNAARFLLRYLLGGVQTRFVHDRHPLELEPEAVQARVRRELSGGTRELPDERSRWD